MRDIIEDQAIAEAIKQDKFNLTHKDGQFYILVKKQIVAKWNRVHGFTVLIDNLHKLTLQLKQEAIMERINNFQYHR